MSTQDNGGRAFPLFCGPGDTENTGGMSLRDYFAAKAMQSIFAVLHQGLRPEDCIKVAEDAYFVADAMLKARAQ